jgi:hypothetical protein
MPGLVPGIHGLLFSSKDVDGRDEPGHDEADSILSLRSFLFGDPACS